MPYLRRLPSGLWQATVRGPGGRKHTRTDPLKSAVKAWALEQEARFRRGDTRDPRAGDISVADWHARVAAARGIEDVTRIKNESLWRVHCEPQWGRWAMGAVTRMEAQGWADRLRATPRVQLSHGAPAMLAPGTIRDIVLIMSQLYTAAMREHPPLVVSNPFSGLELPRVELPPAAFYEPGEAAALYEAIGTVAGPVMRTLTELGMETGLRFGELAGLHGHRVDWLRGTLAVVDVMTRQGLREHPKSKKSNRVVPVPPRVMDGMAAAMAARPRTALVFTGPDGGPVRDEHFRRLVWYPAVELAGVPRYPPRVMRHTAASWLVQDGVPLYDVQALLGHESYSTTSRYAHLAPGAHERVTGSWERRRARLLVRLCCYDLGQRVGAPRIELLAVDPLNRVVLVVHAGGGVAGLEDGERPRVGAEDRVKPGMRLGDGDNHAAVKADGLPVSHLISRLGHGFNTSAGTPCAIRAPRHGVVLTHPDTS